MIIIGSKSNKLGGAFEKKLNKVFDKYKAENKAYIIKVHTKATPIRDKKGRVIKVLYSEKSDCLDYIGLLPNGKPIIFEAKSCGEKTRFPLGNIKEYQFELFDMLEQYTDNLFYIIEFRAYNEVYLVNAKTIKEFKENNKRKSIPYKDFKNIGILINNDLDLLKYIV